MFYDPLTLLKLNFLKKEKKKKIIKTWIVEYHNSIYYISHKRKDGARARRIRKEKRGGKKKKNFAWERLVCGLFKDGCRPSQLTTECRYTQLASLTALRG